MHAKLHAQYPRLIIDCKRLARALEMQMYVLALPQQTQAFVKMKYRAERTLFRTDSPWIHYKCSLYTNIGKYRTGNIWGHLRCLACLIPFPWHEKFAVFSAPWGYTTGKHSWHRTQILRYNRFKMLEFSSFFHCQHHFQTFTFRLWYHTLMNSVYQLTFTWI